MAEKTTKKWHVATVVIAAGMLLVMNMQSNKSDREQGVKIEACAQRGVAYFMSIGSYPKLSDGRIPYDVAKERCMRSLRVFDNVM